MINSIEAFYSEAQQYVALFDAFAQKHELMGRTEADHICYKCDSRESFENLRTLFEHHSAFIYQSIISGRPIAYICMKEGVETKLGTIRFLELSDQKPDHSQRDGFDHIEAYPTTFSYEQMVQELEETETVLKVERPHHTTHDINIGDEFLFRCTHGPLLDKIKETEMF